MGYLVKDLPLDERPRERLQTKGVDGLTLQELLAIIISSGVKGKSAIDIASDIIISYKRLDLLSEASISELGKIHGIGKAKAIKILAAIEIGKRINTPIKSNYKIKKPDDAYSYLRSSMENSSQEMLYCLYLNAKCFIIEEKVISVGGINNTYFNYKDIFKWAIRFSAVGVLIAHNHPSGDVTPSKEDINVTNKIVEYGKMFDIKLLDHIIVGKNEFYSFAKKNLIE